MKIVSGMRPTGKLHLGHYLGVLQNWVELQKDASCSFFVADWHALSTSYEDKLNLKQLSYDLVKDWLSVGIDPKKSTIFIQSQIKEHSELYVLLNMITPLGWLERNPTYKDQLTQIKGKDINTAGFLTYPVLQTADIILHDATHVPIGEDQKPHIEIAREIVRRFHHLYNSEVFTEPKELLSPTPRLLGLDGRKMSKSYDNSIYLTDTSDEVWQKLRSAKTDPARVKKTDPGNPDICLIFDYHNSTSSSDVCNTISQECRAGSIGCIDCKKQALTSLENILEPIRIKRATITNEMVENIIKNGNDKASKVAQEKMKIVNQAIFEIKQ